MAVVKPLSRPIWLLVVTNAVWCHVGNAKKWLANMIYQSEQSFSRIFPDRVT